MKFFTLDNVEVLWEPSFALAAGETRSLLTQSISKFVKMRAMLCMMQGFFWKLCFYGKHTGFVCRVLLR